MLELMTHLILQTAAISHHVLVLSDLKQKHLHLCYDLEVEVSPVYISLAA